MGKKKARRHRNALLARQLLHNGPPAPRNAVLLPFVDSLATLAVCGFVAPDGSCNDCPAAELVDEVRVALHSRIIGNGFRIVKGQTQEPYSHDYEEPVSENAAMGRERDPDAVAAGERLIRTREALGFPTRRRFAQIMDIDESRLQKWESGAAMVRPWFVDRLYDQHGITHDWIYGGRLGTLPHALVLKLQAPSS